MYLGWKHDEPALERGVKGLSQRGPSKTNMYFNYYATQVLHHYEGEEFRRLERLCKAVSEVAGSGRRHVEFREQNAKQHRRQQIAGLQYQGKRQVSADHVKTAVRQIDDAHNAKNQRQAASHQEQQEAILQAVEELNQEEG